MRQVSQRELQAFWERYKERHNMGSWDLRAQGGPGGTRWYLQDLGGHQIWLGIGTGTALEGLRLSAELAWQWGPGGDPHAPGP